MPTMRKTGRGGPRIGSGRPRGPDESVRRNRVTVMLTDAELAKLHRLAESRELPLGTVAYQLFAQGLRRAK